MNKVIQYIFLFLIFLSFGNFSYAQLSEGGIPVSFTKKGLEQNVPVYTMPAVNVETLLAEDEINHATKIGPYRFGAELSVDIDLTNSGNWETLKDGSGLWRLSIKSTGAYSINLIFESFQLAKGSKLFIYNQDKSTVLGAFTEKNNKPHGYFATNLIEGDQITLEYYEPANARGKGHFTLTTVVHAYRNVTQNLTKSLAAGGSGPCNINVNCPLGSNWTNERNAVTRVVLGGGFCTGSLVNNTSNDGTPYYLTANHCYQTANPATWVFLFNYQSSTCNGSNGPGNQSLNGAIFRANNAGSDFALVELDDVIPSSYNPYLAGWRNDDNPSSSSVCIHHPSGDIKKISRDQNPTTSTSFSGASTWMIGAWEEGTTEGGSSGSPLFDEATHQIIGQLYGGSAACNGINPNNEPDFYGKFSTSWDGSSSSKRLRDWLDPSNTGATSVDGYDPNAAQYSLDANAASILIPENGSVVCGNTISPVVIIKNRGSNNLTSLVVTLNLDGNNHIENWTGNLPTNQTAQVAFDTYTVAPGVHTITVTVSLPNGGSDENTQNDVVASSFTAEMGEIVTLTLITDNWGEETSWELADSNNTVLYSVDEDTYLSNTTYDVEFCLPSDACYTFTIYDSYNDGICCGEGQGSYTIKDSEGNVLGSGGEFTSQQSRNFCNGDQNNTGISSANLLDAVNVYPNPTAGELNIVLPDNTEVSSLSIHNLIGETIWTQTNVNKNLLKLDIGDYTQGVYYLNLIAGDRRITKKIILAK